MRREWRNRPRLPTATGHVTDRDSASEFRLDCEFCEAVVSASSATALKARATAHLRENHGEDLRTALSEAHGGEACRNDCGYVFPADGIGVDGFDCPECGHDNFDPFLREYVYWRIENEEPC